MDTLKLWIDKRQLPSILTDVLAISVCKVCRAKASSLDKPSTSQVGVTDEILGAILGGVGGLRV